MSHKHEFDTVDTRALSAVQWAHCACGHTEKQSAIDGTPLDATPEEWARRQPQDAPRGPTTPPFEAYFDAIVPADARPGHSCPKCGVRYERLVRDYRKPSRPRYFPVTVEPCGHEVRVEWDSPQDAP